VAYLAQVQNNAKATDVLVVAGEDILLDKLEALDLGAVNSSGRVVLMVAARADHTADFDSNESPSLHKVGVTLPMDVTDDLENAYRYNSLMIPPTLCKYRIGGTSCLVCNGSQGVERRRELIHKTSPPSSSKVRRQKCSRRRSPLQARRGPWWPAVIARRGNMIYKIKGPQKRFDIKKVSTAHGDLIQDDNI